MKKISGFLVIAFFAATLSVTAQEPKSAPKPAEKMECKMGKDCKMSCCSDKSKTSEKASKASKKKN